MPFSSIEEVFDGFKQLKVIVLGDIMLDVYQYGKIERMSPENAAVSVFKSESEECRLGGAANVANNIKALGAKPILIGVIGGDKPGETIKSLLRTGRIDVDGLIPCENRKTTVKRRLINQDFQVQVLRVDEEDTFDISNDQSLTLLTSLEIHLATADLLIIQDYNKGTLTKPLIDKILERGRKFEVPVAVDPKYHNFQEYKGIALLKPNFSELKVGLQKPELRPDLHEINTAVRSFIEPNQISQLIVSLSEFGMYFTDWDSSEILEAHKRQILDVSGAGDTVLTLAALCLPLGLSTRFSAEMANLAGGLTCQCFGVQPIDSQELLQEANQNLILLNELNMSPIEDL